jgi:phosphoenolpyruvate carboxykinase (GTP)
MNTNVTNNRYVNEWIAEMAKMVKPSEIILIDGSEAQAEALRKEACSTGEMIKLNQDVLPGC